MTINLLNKINRAAFEIGQQGKHDVMVDYYSSTNSVSITIWRNKCRDDNGREFLSSIYIKPETILFKLVSLLNEQEVAA